LVRRSSIHEQNEAEPDGENTDEVFGERVEEARNILEKLEESRRDPKDSNAKNPFFIRIIFLSSAVG
jgi:hypothetical protein